MKSKEDTFLELTSLSSGNIKKKKFYLGPWCLDFEKFIKHKSKILNYPYDDVNLKKIHNNYIQSLYQRIEKPLFLKLNDINKVDRNIKYWRLISKSYLINILSELYEKWVCIQNTKKLKTKFVTNSLYLNFEDFAFNDHYEFDNIKDTYQVNIWDHFCYSLILKEFEHIKIKSIIKKKINIKELKIPKSNYKKYIDLISQIIFLFKKNFKILFLDIHNIRHDITLFSKLKKTYVNLKLPNIIKASYNKSLRNWNIDFKKKNKFEYFISKNLPKLLPLIFIEGFNVNLNQIQNLNNIKSKYYFYISSINSLKNIFLAEKYRAGSNLITTQHGGNYGHLEIYPNENLEIENSNYFLTFGWNSKFQLNNSNHKNKIIPTGALNLGKNNFFSKQSDNIIIIVSGFRYGFQNYQSIPTISQNYNELNEIYNLINNLKPELKKKVILKFRFKDEILFKKFSSYFRKNFREIKIVNNEKSLFELFKNAKLVVTTYSGTAYLEAIRCDIPSIIFWNKKFTVFRKATDKYFNHFKKKKFLHYNHSSLSKFINSKYRFIDIWWTKMQKDKLFNNFKSHFISDDYERYYEQFIKIIKN